MLNYIFNFINKYLFFIILTIYLICYIFRRNSKSRTPIAICLNILLSFIYTCIFAKLGLFGLEFLSELKELIITVLERTSVFFDRILYILFSNINLVAFSTAMSEDLVEYHRCKSYNLDYKMLFKNSVGLITKAVVIIIKGFKIEFNNLINLFRRNLSSYNFVYRC